MALAGLGLLLLVGLPLGIVLYVESREHDACSKPPCVLNERSGAYEGVTVGSTEARVKNLFGNGEVGDPRKVPLPLEARTGELSGPGSFPPSDWKILRYHGLGVAIQANKVIVFVDFGRACPDSCWRGSRRQPV